MVAWEATALPLGDTRLVLAHYGQVVPPKTNKATALIEYVKCCIQHTETATRRMGSRRHLC